MTLHLSSQCLTVYLVLISLLDSWRPPFTYSSAWSAAHVEGSRPPPRQLPPLFCGRCPLFSENSPVSFVVVFHPSGCPGAPSRGRRHRGLYDRTRRQRSLLCPVGHRRVPALHPIASQAAGPSHTSTGIPEGIRTSWLRPLSTQVRGSVGPTAPPSERSEFRGHSAGGAGSCRANTLSAPRG